MNCEALGQLRARVFGKHLLTELDTLFNSPSTISLFIWETRLGSGSFQIQVLTLIRNIAENRLRHARSPVHLHRIQDINIPYIFESVIVDPTRT